MSLDLLCWQGRNAALAVTAAGGQLRSQLLWLPPQRAKGQRPLLRPVPSRPLDQWEQSNDQEAWPWISYITVPLWALVSFLENGGKVSA